MKNLTIEEAKAWIDKREGSLFIVRDQDQEPIYYEEYNDNKVGKPMTSSQLDFIIEDFEPQLIVITSYIKHGANPTSKNIRWRASDTIQVILQEGMNGLEDIQQPSTFSAPKTTTPQPEATSHQPVANSTKAHTTMSNTSIPSFSDPAAYQFFISNLQRDLDKAETEIKRLTEKLETANKELIEAKDSLKSQSYETKLNGLTEKLAVKKDYLEMFMNSPLASAMGPALAGTLDKLVDTAKPLISQMAGAEGGDDPLAALQKFIDQHYATLTKDQQAWIRDYLADIATTGAMTKPTMEKFNQVFNAAA